MSTQPENQFSKRRDPLERARAARDAARQIEDAAPDLLRACRLALDCVDRFGGKLSPGAIDRLRSAIAKAEGHS